MSNSVNKTYIHLYADETVLLSTGRNIDTVRYK